MRTRELTRDELWALMMIWRGQNHFVRSQQMIEQLTNMGLISKGRITDKGRGVLRERITEVKKMNI